MSGASRGSVLGFHVFHLRVHGEARNDAPAAVAFDDPG
jgi:hypothetical protein